MAAAGVSSADERGAGSEAVQKGRENQARSGDGGGLGDDGAFPYLEDDCGGAFQDAQMIQKRTGKCMFVILEFLPVCRWRLELVLMKSGKAK